ncbi:hypothetical protein CF15_01630 [Pyrodictium occultum]|uniref:Metallo-beta-lactamase domain-containing protein n=1 Tax=Pyrodictium occultum TaxID=2309 RepID=A0A0V8RU20_PYROC|nr:MBL fold metallo-hydrolase [Pyrodictium occultum]KSW11563.1 hypothetical protein CF15_01630 [Pyrodictium occultum]
MEPLETLDLGYALVQVLDATPEGFGVDYIRSYIVDAGGPAVAVIDTGPASTAEAVAEAAARAARGRRVEVIVTHVHLDHAGGAARVARLLHARGLEARIRAHPRGAPHLVDPASRLWPAARKTLGELALLYGEPEPAPAGVVAETGDGEEIALGAARLRVLHTPGHASHHQSLVLEPASGGDEEKLLFTGDSAGMYDPLDGGLAPTTPPPLRLDMYRESLRRMKALGPGRVAPTHIGVGPGEVLELHERQLDAWEQAAREALEKGLTAEETLQAIAGRDAYTRRLYERLGRSPYGRLMLILSVHGFVDYLKRLRGRG